MCIKPEQVAKLLQDADGAGATVQIIETHISWLFLTESHVFKLKKPVRFEFLDYSSAARRRWACQEEIRLNERLAPHVCERLVAITQASGGGLELNGDGSVADWLVQMRRLPAENAVDVMLREGRLMAAHVHRIAQHLARFYKAAPRSAIGVAQYRQNLAQHIRANRSSLLATAPSESKRLTRIHEAQLRFLNVNREVLDSRVTNDRVVEGHGDLRPEHIYINGEPLIIDCVEFSADLRTVDIADELSFLAMECERLGDGGLGAAVMREYQELSEDNPPASLLDFYRSYRATVRAKVIAIRAQQQQEAGTYSSEVLDSYLMLADSHASRLDEPIVIVVSGLIGSGKSTLAAALQRRFDCEIFSTDRLRQEIFGAAGQVNYGEGNYTPQLKRQVYDEMFRRASTNLANRCSAILDGTFLQRSLRDEARGLALRHRATFVLVHCVCPRAVSLARIERRTNLSHNDSEARAEHYDAQAKEFQSSAEDELVTVVDTTLSIREQLSRVLTAAPLGWHALTTKLSRANSHIDVPSKHSPRVTQN